MASEDEQRRYNLIFILPMILCVVVSIILAGVSIGLPVLFNFDKPTTYDFTQTIADWT